MKSIKIADTTREERQQIIRESLDCGAGGCENCSAAGVGGGSVDGILPGLYRWEKGTRPINLEYSSRMAGKQRR
jgi:hypothetical protein